VDFHIGAPIFDRSGQRLGSLKHVIVDPDTKEVAEIVLEQSGIMGRDVVVPLGAVNKAGRESVELALDKEQARALPDFILTKYETPPPDLVSAYPWATGALIAQGMAPVGAAAGLESIAFTPIVDTIEQIPPGDVDLSPGTEVWASDGKIGSIRDVIVDEQTRRIRGFIIESGFLLHKDTEVSLDQVVQISEDRVTLKVSKADLNPAS
jgi:uncharacterized protein YrrD